MSIEQQLERLNINLEKIIAKGIDLQVNTAGILNPIPARVASTKTPVKPEVKETPEPEPEAEAKTEVKETPEPEEKTSNTSSITFDSLADKVKALAKLDREAARAVFTSMKVTGLSGVDEKDYVKLDLALAKALNVAKAAKEEA